MFKYPIFSEFRDSLNNLYTILNFIFVNNVYDCDVTPNSEFYSKEGSNFAKIGSIS